MSRLRMKKKTITLATYLLNSLFTLATPAPEYLFEPAGMAFLLYFNLTLQGVLTSARLDTRQAADEICYIRSTTNRICLLLY